MREIMNRKEKLEKKIDEMYDFYNDVFVKKYKDRNDLKNQMQDVFINHILPYQHVEKQDESIPLIKTHKMICLEIEKHLDPYSYKDKNHIVEISEKRVRLIDPLINFLFYIKEEIEDRRFNIV